MTIYTIVLDLAQILLLALIVDVLRDISSRLGVGSYRIGPAKTPSWKKGLGG